MSRLVGFCRSLVRRSVRAYHLVCLRDDLVTHKVVVPDGVWACADCGTVVLAAAAPSSHLCTDHTVY